MRSSGLVHALFNVILDVCTSVCVCTLCLCLCACCLFSSPPVSLSVLSHHPGVSRSLSDDTSVVTPCSARVKKILCLVSKYFHSCACMFSLASPPWMDGVSLKGFGDNTTILLCLAWLTRCGVWPLVLRTGLHLKCEWVESSQSWMCFTDLRKCGGWWLKFY